MLSLLLRILAACSLGGGLLLAGLHPVWPVVQVAGVSGLALVCFRWPMMLAALFPSLLVIADGYPITGQIIVNEWDSLLLGSFAGAWLGISRGEKRSVLGDGKTSEERKEPAARPWLLEAVVWGVLAIATLFTMLLGWRTLPAGLAADQFSVYFDQWNAVREGKGYLFAFGFAFSWLALVVRCYDVKQLLRLFQVGVLVALAYVSVGVAVERAVYQGLFDFSENYRATGPAWTMHVGGHHVDAILVLGFPLIWFGYRLRGGIGQLSWRLAFSVLVGYAVLATLSRITLALVPLEVMGLVALNRAGTLAGVELTEQRTHWMKRLGLRGVWLVVGLMLACIGFYSVLQMPTVRQRFDRSPRDSQTRLTHWQQAFGSDDNLTAQWFAGSGLGSVPTMVTSGGERAFPPLKVLASGDGSDHSVVMQPQWPVYLEHWTFDHGQSKMTVSGSVKGVDGHSKVSFIRCYKSLLYSYATTSKAVKCDEVHENRFTIELPPLNAAKQGIRWPAVQSIAAHVSGKQAVELSDLKVEYSGHVIDSFPESRWMFTCDEHLTWRTKNGPLHVLLSSGLIGVAALGCLVIPMLRLGSLFLTAEVAPISIGLVALVMMTSVTSLIDTPWITALTLGYVAVLGTRKA